ncbi:tyrosine-protein phosphatase [Flavobacterium luminosum]|uniref:protein-tyrosine-phosphatase n=1 Tax=Flavobacterium luminosum TaxID=2949086 RepID=A0ABT0TNQ1_9FLAO|nr:CpsB/CapC family capsule biosynthesis tyrosine phosphatase [Flavobacterium sp. HXWNR70]MCL9809105.1 histidinol phosphatase [Flavobacterium sp. HXWNR70]
MFFFTKNRPILQDLIPDGAIDIHSHLLPGIDDGAKTIEDTEYLIGALQKIGFTKFITTPHTFSGFWDNTKEGIEAKAQETQQHLATKQFDMPLQAASEYLLDDHFATLFKKGELLTLKDNLVLVEMSYLNAPIHLYDLLFDLQVAGYQPVLAHPERYAFYHKNFDEYRKLKNAGCYLQLNLLATVGYYGSDVAEAAKKLLEQGLYDFVGSDVHHQKHINAFQQRVLIKDTKALEAVIQNNRFFV